MPLDPWMFVGKIDAFEKEGADHVLKKLWEGGIRTIVLGDLILDGHPAFAPDPECYRDTRIQPPAMPAELAPRARIVADAVQAAKNRGFGVYLHDWGQFRGRCLNDPEYVKYAVARSRDAFGHYPGLDGFIADGPEYGYEIEPGHRSDIFRCFCECCEAKARASGYDFEAIRLAADRFRGRLNHLDREVVERLVEVPTGLFDPVDLLMWEPDLFDWLRFKTESILDLLGGMRAGIREIDPRLRLACGPRTAAFAPLTAYNFRRLNEVTDFICPKFYFWMHGIDGLKGTVYRWAKTLMGWHAWMSEGLALKLVYKIFGFSLPGVERLEDLGRPLSGAFFTETVAGEISKAILRVGDVGRLRPWVGLHHGGVRMDASEMRPIMVAMEQGGLRSYIHWHYSDMQPVEWEIVKSFCAR
ncbi:hypothetical protein HYY27_07690 [bacterium]|nr:hypothetical protein [bacterium]